MFSTPLRDISYWGMIPALSSSSRERGIFTSPATFTGSIGYNSVTTTVVPILELLQRYGWCRVQLAGWLDCLRRYHLHPGYCDRTGCGFRYHRAGGDLRTHSEEGGNLLQAFKAIGQNDQLLWISLSYLLFSIANVATTGFLLYHFIFIIRDKEQYSVVGLIAFITGLVLAPLYPAINRFIQRRYLYLAVWPLMIVAYILFILFPQNLALVYMGTGPVLHPEHLHSR